MKLKISCVQWLYSEGAQEMELRLLVEFQMPQRWKKGHHIPIYKQHVIL